MVVPMKSSFSTISDVNGGVILGGVFPLKNKGASSQTGRPNTFSARWVRELVRGVLWLLGILVVRPVAFLLALRTRRCLPPISNQLLLMRAKDLAEAIRTRQVRAEDAVSAYIKRIQEVNLSVNAVVDARFSAALLEAKEIDKRLDAGDEDIKDLAMIGVPITVKESIAVKGLSFLGGKPLEPGEERTATRDAPSVTRLRNAGAIPLCVTNTPELCLWWESYNSNTGYTSNPYDSRLTAGGSSGGEGALLGSAASILGLGSDVAGSCRLPAFFCGVCGHKPSPGVVPWTGHAPECDDPSWSQFFTLGPMARYISDLPLALEVLAGDRARELRLRDKVDIRSVRVLYVESEPTGSPVHQVGSEVRDGMLRALEHLRSKGMSVQRLELPGLEDAAGMSALLMLQLRRVHTVNYDPDNPDELKGVWSHLFRYLTCRTRSTFHAVVAGVLFWLGQRTPRGLIKAASAHQARMRSALQEALGDDGVLLYPPGPTPAFRRHLTWHRMLDNSYLMLFNCLGLPVTQVPLGLAPSGLPIGVQVVAAKNQDRLTLAVAQELENGLGGWVPPPCNTQTPQQAQQAHQPEPKTL